MSVVHAPPHVDTHIGTLSRLLPRTPAHATLAVEAPADGALLWELPLHTADDVAEAVERARAAQPAWAASSPAVRRRVLLGLHRRILAEQEQIMDVIQHETGKARRDAFEEVMDVALHASHLAHRARRLLRPQRRQGLFPGLIRTAVHHLPLGVVGFITPWNYPLALGLSDLLPALLAGNAVVLKPAEQTTLTALYGLRLLRDAGLPEGLLQVVAGRGETLGPPLIDAVDGISFTGSTPVGRRIAEQAGRRLIPCTLELGGKNPMIVLADASLDRAMEGAVQGCFSNAGQLCIAFERIYIQRPLLERFTEALCRRTDSLRLGTGPDAELEMGSLLSAAQLSKVQRHVEDAVAKGARLLSGGRPRPDLGPYFFEPTLFAEVTEEMLMAQEETFGPVVALYPFDTDEQAVAAANDSGYGLNASVWSRDGARADRVARQLRCGTVNVNEAYIAAWGSFEAPMGGMGQSGLGRRHGPEGFYKYTETQTVAQQRGISLGPPSGFSFATYARALRTVAQWMPRLPGLR